LFALLFRQEGEPNLHLQVEMKVISRLLTFLKASSSFISFSIYGTFFSCGRERRRERACFEEEEDVLLLSILSLSNRDAQDTRIPQYETAYV